MIDRLLRSPRATGLALLAALLASPAPAQTPPQVLEAFIRTQAKGSPLSIKSETLVAAARKAGVVRTPADIAAAKKTLARLQHEQRQTLPRDRAHTRTGGVLAIGPEQESNDHIGLADLGGAGTSTVTGDLGVNDVDTFRFLVPGDSAVQFATSAFGPAPVGDTAMFILDVDGQVVDFNDDSGVSLYSQIDAQLPAGTYFVKVQGWGFNSGGYQLSATMTPMTLPVLTNGQPLNATFTTDTERHTYLLPLAGESALSVATSGSGGDLIMGLHGLTMGQVHEVDDSTGGGLYPIIQTQLTGGVWYVVVKPYPFSQPGAYTITATVASRLIGPVPCNSSTNGNTVGSESFDVYRLVNANPPRITLSTSGGTLQDTVIDILDQDFRRLTYNDDATSLYSLIDTVLPPGIYYVVVRPYPGNSGSYTLSAACGQSGPVGTLANGRTTATITNLGETAAFNYQLGTSNPVEFRTDLATATIGFGIVTVLDGSGRVVAFDDSTVFATGDALCGNRLAAGTYTVLVRDYYAGSGTVDLVTRPMLSIEPRGAGALLHSLDKAGRLHVLFASNTAGPGIPLLGAVTGNFLLNPGLVIFVAAGGMAADGTYTWPLPLTGFGGVVQAVSLDLATVTGEMTNLER